ncbi:hypothetical protein G647_06695 [Cladophialophora carrionii CBS 160.54]|uniref:Zn(2)-C6 fungal-type domain-containing protein n=1 Tax=Cladophialophora carrionii CBS 160.54 TaxID=1279043 RepID=V9D6S5_9EURO|nr:uncharacterized protein G647_06695 [Cladophialophora carrionii CBS 160.54]ETI22619.1 hypothetical protein G647_06695 [Cladophialophora carrionii CBS 160.54]
MATMTPPTTTQTSPKRKSSAAGLSAGGRTVKRRASKACHCCRGRKVRCDVVESGIPCTNCRLDEVECVVTEGKRRRKTYSEGELFHQSPCNSAEDEKELPQFPIFDDIDELNNFLPSLPSCETTRSLKGSEDVFQHKPHMLYQTQGHRLSQEERFRRMSVISSKQQSPSLSLAATMSYFPQQPSRPNIVLPPFIRPISPMIMTEDLEFLQRKGALLIPETGFRNELLRCYVQYVYPFMPIIDLQDFLGTIEKNQATDTVSLLLFQAVMFAATAYIDMRYLLAQGYMTRKAARKSFFEKVKLLYDFDYEADRITIVQAALLMTYWYESPDDPKDVWHWLGIATSVARTIGLNCDTSNAPLMTPQQRRLWKRIWWSCYMRDRLIAIGMRRPMRINDGDFDVQMLDVSDFETESLSPELSKMLGGCPAVKDSSKRVTLAKMCIGLAQLCLCISKVLAVQYSTLGHKIGATQETTMRLVPKKSAAEPADVIQCDREFDQWHQSLDPGIPYFAPDSRERVATNDGEVVHLHRALLNGVYLTAISALHRPQILPSAPNVVVVPELRELSKRKVREAADDITEMYKELFALDMIRYLPNTGVTCLLPAIIIHLLDIKSTDNNIRQASTRKFHFCMQALQRLREMYASADFAFSFLDAAVRKTNAQVSAAAAATPTMKESLSHPPVEQKLGQAPLLLTPPPEAMQTASLLLMNSTLAPEERSLIAAYTPRTPAGSDVSLSSHTTAGAASALTDLPEEHSTEIKDELEQTDEADFDTLMDLESGTDLFAMAEDDMDLSMQWLQGFDADKLSPGTGEFPLQTIEEVEEPGYAQRALDLSDELGIGLSM